MKRTILSLIAICSTSLALQAQMPQSYTLKSCLEYGLQNNYSLRITPQRGTSQQKQRYAGKRRLSADT